MLHAHESVVVLCILVAYNPIRYYFETHFYGVVVARMVVVFDEASVANWIVRHLDTLLLIGLAATALLRRDTLRPLWKILFHWILFVCALWAAGPPPVRFKILRRVSRFWHLAVEMSHGADR